MLAAIAIVVGVSVLAFSLLHLLPGDPVLVMVGDSGAPPERLAELRRQLGLDDPLAVQYARPSCGSAVPPGPQGEGGSSTGWFGIGRSPSLRTASSELPLRSTSAGS